MMNKLEIDSIQLHVGNHRQLLTDCYLSCSSEEIIGILGRNGSGKSSLFEIIFGTLEPSNKFIRINGQVCKTPFAKKLVGYIPQTSIFPKDATVQKLLKFLLNSDRFEDLKKNKRIESILFSKIRHLSGGELKYLEVSTILHMDHPFVLLDEPFSGIEPIFQSEIQDLLTRNPYKKGILVSDHNFRNIMDVSNKLFLLNDGALVKITKSVELEYLGYVPKGTFSED